MIITLEEFKNEFEKIKNSGWIRTHRNGTTGIGKTLEDLLGINENNNDAPDFGEYELKAHRTNNNSLITLLTKTPKPKRINKKLFEDFGYLDKSSNRYVLHATLSTQKYTTINQTTNKLKIDFIEDNLHILWNSNSYAYWDMPYLEESIQRKYSGSLIYVTADSRGSGKNEEFLFKNAWHFTSINTDSFISLIKSGKIYVDIRIGRYPDGRLHDHGTAFRIYEVDFPLLCNGCKL